MRIEVEVPVLTWGQMKPTHSQKRVFGSIPRTFDIPEYSAHEVPPVLAFALGIPTNDLDDDDDESVSAKVKSVEYCGLGGELYVNRMHAPNSEYARALHYKILSSSTHPYFDKVQKDIDYAIAALRKENWSSYPKKMIPEELGIAHQDHREIKIAPLQEIGIHNYYQCTVDEQLAEFTKRMERMIIVGGQVFIQEQEPFIQIEGNSKFYIRPTLKLRTRPEPERIVNVDNFSGDVPHVIVSLADIENLDEHADFLRECSTSYTSLNLDSTIRDIEIYDQRYLRLSSEATTLVAAANMLRINFVGHMEVSGMDISKAGRVQQKMLDLDPSVFELFHRLVRGISNSTEMEASEELESTIASIIEKSSTQNLSAVFGGPNVLRYAANALQRWHDRNVELDIGVQPKFSS